MFKTATEKYLFIVVLISGLGFGGSYLYQNADLTLVLLQDDVDEKLENIESMQSILDISPRITARFDAMENELKLGLAGDDNEKAFNDMSNSQQELQIRQEITAILTEVGLENAYGNIQNRDPDMLEDFKVFTISIDQLECTPQQLGQLLYRLEQQSEVMEVEQCRIDNLIGDRGDLPRRRDENLSLDATSGLLSVDLQISRLIEYRQGEAPQRSRRRS